MQLTKSSSFFLVVAAFTAIVCAFSLSKRVAIEQANNQYAIAAEADTLETIASANGKTLEESISEFKRAGINAIVLPEQTIGELISEGRIDLFGIRLQKESAAKVLKFNDEATVARVVRGLGIRFGKLVQNSRPRDGQLTLPPVDAASIRSTAVGLDPRMVQLAQANGMMIIARCSNPLGVTSTSVRETLKWTKEMGASVFLAQGDQVLGRRDSINVTIETLDSLKMLYASPEFAKLGGDVEMLNGMPKSVVRLHSAQAAELDKLSLGAAVERYRKAAKERNMRILLVRPVSFSGDDTIKEFTQFVGQISYSLNEEGLTIGVPQPYQDPNLSKTIKLLIGLLSGVAALWVASNLIDGQNGLIVGGLGALAIVIGAATSGKGLQISTLLMAMTFPIGAYLWLISAKPNFIVGYLGVAFGSMTGGLCVAGMLNSVDYFIKADSFSGVKISLFLPLLIIGISAFSKLNNLKEALKEPITWGAAALGLVILAVVGLMLVRSGNDSPSAVSGGELAFRGFLEELMPVRPRTKSFLMGFPALVIAIQMLVTAGYQKEKLGKAAGWVALLLMLSGIAMTDVMNTMCHLHTPVLTSVIRNLEGIVLGLIIGLVVWLVVKKPVSKLLENRG